ncbi:hypothetical protein QJU23_04345 [Pasteurella atlantica]|uniref:Uncharacterized protein n=2 Tax=Pasteurellaceae TaxID=712 RepID=A0ACC6HLA1_9PAST|nr:hypothetical protein [Pasteurella atlantica]MDP8051657.1 hypothetical protein [Pasteurella atlantica]MDP8105020.1 hypothetical protein [Pasteurella atlantica]MDP8148315.1 hypothetical protein [Pasteurella atlantica]
MKIVKYESLFVFSDTENLCFYKEFKDGMNIVTGCNTSGKSTLIQSLLFSFGINDVRRGLSEVLKAKPIFRLDFSVTFEDEINNYIVVRDDEHLYIKEPDGKIQRFNGVNANNNREHTKLKSYMNNLLGFSLKLEQKNEFKPAPIEAAFLPYYISQSVGWVYLRESFSNFSFYKNFKYDFLDYYLGITGSINREKLIELEQRRKDLKSEIKSLKKYVNQPEFKIAQLLDEKFGEKAREYVKDYIEGRKKENTQIDKVTQEAEKLSLLEHHKKIVSRTIRQIEGQKPSGIDKCPACKQILQYSLTGLYEHYQKAHDSEALKKHLDGEVKKVKSSVTTCNAKLGKIIQENSEKFKLVEALKIEDTTLELWLDRKATVQLQLKLEADIKKLSKDLSNVEGDIEKLIGDTELEAVLDSKRKSKITRFKKMFRNGLSILGVKQLTEERYLDIYQISSFPYQGVELHKTMLAYHFNFNSIISSSINIHRLPFLLDGILKEDIDQNNFPKLFNFIESNRPQDTQTFMSISDYKDKHHRDNQARKSIDEIITEYFPNANKITIGDGIQERAFLSEKLDKTYKIYQDTYNIMELN